VPTPRARRRRQLWILVALALLVGSVWFTNYQMTSYQRTGCKRGIVNYKLNAHGWGIAHDRALSQGQPGFAAQYRELHNGLVRLSRTDCAQAYPRPFPLNVFR
jgi:hypothetical protein